MKTKKMTTTPFTRATPLVYEFTRGVKANGSWMEMTYSAAEKKKTIKYSDGSWYQETYDENGYLATLTASDGFISEKVNDVNGKVLASKNSDGVFKIHPNGESRLKEVSKTEYDAFINTLLAV